MTFGQLLNKTQKLTNCNDHNSARIVIAEYYNFETFIKIFKGIKMIHSAHKSLDFRLLAMRENETANMFVKILEETDEQTVKQLAETL